MTQQEFDDLRFCAGMIAEYGGNWYEVVSCSFPERLFGLGDDTTTETTDLLWVRCENVTQLKYSTIIGNIHDNLELLKTE